MYEWWIQCRGTAFGIITSAGCFRHSHATHNRNPSSQIRPPQHPSGHRHCHDLLTGPLIPLLKGRLPPSQTSAVTRIDWSFVRKPLFFIYCTANAAQGLGFFFPALFLPSYATSIGLSARRGALLLALMSVAQVLGQSIFGILSDKAGLDPLLVLPTIVAVVATFTGLEYCT